MRVISSLRRAFTLHYIIAATVPIVLFAWFSFRYANDYLLQQVFQTNTFLAHEVRAQVEDFLHLRSTSLKHVAITALGESAIDLKDIDLFLSEEVENLKEFESIYILDRSGKVVNLGLPANQGAVKKDYKGVDLSGNELFRSFDSGEDPGWSDIYTSLVTGEPSISLGVASGDLLVIGNFNLRRLGEIITRFSLFEQPLATDSWNQSLTFAIIDRKGVPIAHTDVEKVLRRQGMLLHPEIVNALSGKSGTDLHLCNEKLMVESGLPVEETGWVVWISRDYDLVTQPLSTTRNIFFLVLTISILAAVLFGLMTARNVLRPLGALVEGVRALTTGGGNFRQGRRSYTEINDLTQGFQRMSQSVLDRETSLRMSENRFRSLVNSIEGVVFEADFPNIEFTFVSERSEQILGYLAEQWLGKPDFWQQCIHPDDRLWAFNYSLSQAESGRNHQFEYRIIHKDGHVVWVRQMVNVVVEDGKTTRLIGVMIDVTGSKEAAISLQDSEQRFRSLVEQAADAIFIHDADGQLIDVNEQACRSLGYSRDELKRKLIADIQMLQSPLEFTSLQNSVMRGGSLTFEAEHRRKNNSLFPVEIRLGSFQYNDNPFFLALVRDITDREKAVAALRESEEQVRLLLNSTSEGIFGVDCDQKCTFCNPAGLKLLGYEKEENLLGQNTHELFHHSHVDGSTYPLDECLIYSVLNTGKEVHSDTESFWRADGSHFSVEYFAHPVLKNDDLVGVVIAFHDVTERKILQQQSIRTAQLALLGELAAGVAHEINNPISGVINYAQIMLNRKIKSGEDTELIERILKEGERVATIVKDLLFFARESGPEKSLSDIREVLEDSLSLSAAQTRKEGIMLNIDYAENLPMVNTRAQQIQQLFLNLLSNARHALNEKYPNHNANKKIDIFIKPVKHDNVSYVQIIFKDYGIGISEQMLERVMHPFVTTKSSGVGTGLGLSISLEIVKQHGGHLWIESVEGEATEVFVELPIVRKD